MKKSRKLILAVLSMVLLVILCACDIDVTLNSTKVTVDSKNFSGSRVMVMQIDDKKEVTDAVTKVFKENLPDELTMSADSHSDHCVYTFTLKFSSLSDYEKKVESLTGKNVTITYEEPVNETYSTGYTLVEDFTTEDLFKWAKDAAEQHEDVDSVKIITEKAVTSVVLDGKEAKSDKKTTVNITPKSYYFKDIKIKTERFGDNDYKRTVYFNVDKATKDAYGDSLVDLVIAPAVKRIPADLVRSSGWNEDGTAYVIEFNQCNFDNLKKATLAVFPGSEISYSSDETTNPFKESGTLTEKIVAADYACGSDLKANLNFEYVTKNGTSQVLKEGNYTNKKVTEATVKTAFETNYTVSNVEVTLDVSFTGSASSSIVLTYADASSSVSGATLAKKYFDSKYGSAGITTEIQNVPYSSPDEDISSRAILVLTAKGTDEEITKAMSTLLGESGKYSLTIGKRDGFSIKNTYNVKNEIDLTAFVKQLPSYSGTYTYTFNGTGTTIKNVTSVVGGKKTSDFLGGKENWETMTAEKLKSPQISFAFQYTSINIISLLIILVGAAAVLIVISLITRSIARRKSQKKLAQKESVAKEAIKSVALAVIPEAQRGALTELPPELTQRPSVVLEPKIDDGLDEDGDEPENVWLFNTALKLLALLAAILFFFPLATASASAFLGASSESLSGLNLVAGTEIFGVTTENNIMASVLLIIPLVIIALLSVKDMLPRFTASVGVLGLSVFQIIYYSTLAQKIEEVFEFVKNNSTEDYITSATLDIGYNYSMAIYILIAIGAVVLLGADLAAMMRSNRTLDSEE